MSIFSFLGREDVCNQVIPVEEPTRAKDIENVKNRGLLAISHPEVGGDDAGGGGGAGGDGEDFLAHLEGGGEDRVRRQVVDILR